MISPAVRYDPGCNVTLDASGGPSSPAQDPGHQLLQCILQLCAPDATATTAETLLDRCGSLSGVLTASPEALERAGLSAVSSVKVEKLYSCFAQLARWEVGPRPIINSWNALLSYVRTTVGHERRERFHVLFLDRRLRLIRDERLGSGTVDHAPVYPREVMRRALELSASALILVHNHPSGDATPSKADIDITRQIADAGRVLGITVHDHLVVGGAEVASFKSLGLF